MCPTVVLYLFWSSPHWCSVHAGYSHTSFRPSRHLLQFVVPVWPTPIHSLLFSRAWPLTLIPLHAVFHTLSPSLPVSLTLSLIDAYIYLFCCLSFCLSLFLTATGVMPPYILRQLINGLPGDTYNIPVSVFCQSRQVSNFISTLPVVMRDFSHWKFSFHLALHHS